ncbi:hypothetical protein SAMN05518801_102237 [Novosphingobium sp. CF614]|uniref:hypothetical protein n=1 Tax=Novosphingobium sp. CF614 TaxID=1884364 RepID=UPI0008EA5E51|nr:hypothetical protein [Novosphingobium sp. CF614]SFF85715.1 hypothetical protein SAMN05518801_102237 [Novosphingobium sp. CF614]
MKRILCPLLGLLALGACGKSDSGSGPGGVTAGEARALDEAAAMLDERRPPAEALTPSQAQWPQGSATEAGE